MDKNEDICSKEAHIRVVELLKNMSENQHLLAPEEKSNSKEEVQKMSEEQNMDFEKAQTELANAVLEVGELKNSLIDKDKEMKSLKDDLSTVTEAKNVAEAELAKIAQEKKDSELLGYIEREVKLSITEDSDESKAERLNALRKLNDEALEVYTGMLSFQEKITEEASATRKTVENNAPADVNVETESLKAQLEAAFGIKKKD